MRQSHMESNAKPNAHKTTFGVRVIIVYKAIKACVQLGLVLLIIVLAPFGLAERLHEYATVVRHHLTHAWSIRLADLLLRTATPHALMITLAALAGDGLLTSLEAWALTHGHWWGPWLVVIASGSLLPFELVHLARRPRASRLLLFGLNLVIVVYLARRAWREHRERRQPAPVAR
jgi:uncharacterized membrane protein (DUF2068 family)